MSAVQRTIRAEGCDLHRQNSTAAKENLCIAVLVGGPITNHIEVGLQLLRMFGKYG